MMKAVHALMNSTTERKHVLLLIENTVLRIEFKTRDTSIFLFLKNGEVLLTDQVSDDTKTCTIHGEAAKLKDLIAGKEKLRALMMKGDLQCSAPFRTILMLESFFYLNKINPYIEKTC